MDTLDHYRDRRFFRGGIIIFLVLAYGGGGFYFRAIHHLDIVHTHFAYIPIVLAGLWWKRKGILIALVLAGITFSFRFFNGGQGALWADLFRTLFFLVVAFCIGLLSEQVMKAQKALSLSEEKYRLLIDRSGAGILVHRGYQIVFLNHRLGSLLGYDGSELMGTSVLELIHQDDREKCRELISERRNRAGSDSHYESRFLKKSGAIIWVDLVSSQTLYEGEPSVLVNIYDITGRKESEDKRQELLELSRRQEEQLVHSARLAELGEMAASIAHEINQPLTGIKNFAKNASYMIENDIGGLEEIKKNIKMITEQVDRASRIIGQMRSLTRKSEAQFSPLDVNDIIKESVEFLSPQFRLHEIKVTLDLSEDLPLVRGDRIRLEQVFLNILTNSRQAMEEVDSRRLVIKTGLDNGLNCPVVVEITDTGVGFTPEEGKKIFTPFFSTKKLGVGTGLGLPISSTIIKEHGGEIEAIGAPGVGSVFKIMLPPASLESVGSGRED